MLSHFVGPDLTPLSNAAIIRRRSAQIKTPMRVLVLGGYGLIGAAVARALHAARHEVTAVGRSTDGSLRMLPRLRWIAVDIAALRAAADWQPLLANIDVVVNASGALQDGSRDNLEHIHHTAVAALVAACESHAAVRLIQISAPRVALDSTTNFMRSKARGDAAIKRSAIDWIILRPGLVIGPNAYGGSALLRMLAAVPLVNAVALGDRRIQTVAISDLVEIVLEAVDGRVPRHADIDLVEAESHTLQQVIGRFRIWMGNPPPRATFAVPHWCLGLVAAVADALGHLGWRSPLRSNALRALEDEILGDASQVRALRGADLLSLDQTLSAMPATLQERWFARLYLLMPLMVAVLSLFWLLSGLIGVMDVARAAATLPAAVVSTDLARVLVIGGAVIDVILGAAVLYRPFAKLACMSMLAVSCVYLIAGSVLTPALWLDPLGPFLKVLPAMALAVVTLAVLEER